MQRMTSMVISRLYTRVGMALLFILLRGYAKIRLKKVALVCTKVHLKAMLSRHGMIQKVGTFCTTWHF